MNCVTRFAPSPTGPLHLGHAFSACTAFDLATQLGGTFLLRIEDLDQSRSRPEWVHGIGTDLHWLGLHWPEPVMHQSDRVPAYRTALEQLWNMGLLYPCHCSRADIRAAASAPQEGVLLHGPDGLIYPGTCRPAHPLGGPMPDGALRLDMARALARLTTPLRFDETGAAPDGTTGRVYPGDLTIFVGDVVLSRRDMAAAYHLAVVVDDAAQGVTHVVRGQDLFDATQIHVLLQRLLDLSTPVYHHHRLIRDDEGKRLAKRDDARAISRFRDDGWQPDDIRRHLGL